MRRLSLTPPERTAALQASWEELSADVGPCGEWAEPRLVNDNPFLPSFTFSVSLPPPAGGFSHQYWCACDQLGVAYREEVQWVCPPRPPPPNDFPTSVVSLCRPLTDRLAVNPLFVSLSPGSMSPPAGRGHHLPEPGHQRAQSAGLHPPGQQVRRTC